MTAHLDYTICWCEIIQLILLKKALHPTYHSVTHQAGQVIHGISTPLMLQCWWFRTNCYCQTRFSEYFNIVSTRIMLTRPQTQVTSDTATASTNQETSDTRQLYTATYLAASGERVTCVCLPSRPSPQCPQVQVPHHVFCGSWPCLYFQKCQNAQSHPRVTNVLYLHYVMINTRDTKPPYTLFESNSTEIMLKLPSWARKLLCQVRDRKDRVVNS